jgi:predicted HAD superfamily Cof-like phosphohydrolase
MMKRKEIESELARETAYSRISDRNYGVQTNFDRTRVFHEAMGLPVRLEPAIPTVQERILRAQLLLEECVETITKGLGVDIVLTDDIRKGDRVAHAEPGWEFSCLSIDHSEGVKYDPIETLDGLADVKVIANGTAVQFGLPMDAADYEVWASNMTKLDESGKPIINGVTEGYRVSDGSQIDIEQFPDAGIWCDIRDPDEPGYRSDQPIGKILKPSTYVPANIVKVFVQFAGDEDENLNRAWLLAHGE